MADAAIEFKNVTKRFGSVVANDHVSMTVNKGEILSLLGENGSGKTSLMNMLSGIYFPDEGEIFINGEPVTIRDPKDAYALKIGMVHQHFKLVDVFTAAENLIVGIDPGKKLDRKEIAGEIKDICDKYGFVIDTGKKVYDMSVSEKQTLEIVKMLYRGADILILDEPTAVLTPQESEHLFSVIKNMKKDGKTVIIITHKLHEVLSVSDRVAILRKGKYIETVLTGEADEEKLTELMVGRHVELNIERPEVENKELRLSVKNLNCVNSEGQQVLFDINFDLYGGEILGIAGISGNGQKELLEAIAGLQKTQSGASVVYYDPESDKKDEDGKSAGMEMIGLSPRMIREKGIHLSFVPEDRLGMGLVGSMGMTENMMIRDYSTASKSFLFTDKKKPRELAEEIKESLCVVTPDISTPVSRLSGGNVQKVLVGREIAAAPAVLMTAYAVRGLDINTSYTIYDLLNEQKKKGVAIIYVGEDLDVILALCDRILVLCDGHVNGILNGAEARKEEVGLLMTELKEKRREEIAE